MYNKVFVIPSWYPPHGGAFFRDYSQSIHQQGFETIVLVNHMEKVQNFSFSNLGRKASINKAGDITEYHFTHYRIPSRGQSYIDRWAQSTLKAFEQLTAIHGKPGLIHAHSSIWAGYAAHLIHQKYHIPYIITEHRSRFVHNNKDAAALLKPQDKPFIRKALQDASAIVSVSKSMIPALTAINPSINNRIEAIPNMVDTDTFKPSTTEKNTGDFTFFSLGHLEYVKGIDLLLNAFTKLQNQHPKNIFLRIGGSGTDKQQLQALAKRLDIAHQLEWLGQLRQDEVVKEMQRCDAFILPSRFEAFGVVFIEAMACGKPVIATASGGPSEFITKDTGLIANNNDSDDIAAAMNFLIRHSALFDQQKIRTMAVDHFSQTAIASKYAKLYHKILKTNKL